MERINRARFAKRPGRKRKDVRALKKNKRFVRIRKPDSEANNLIGSKIDSVTALSSWKDPRFSDLGFERTLEERDENLTETFQTPQCSYVESLATLYDWLYQQQDKIDNSVKPSVSEGNSPRSSICSAKNLYDAIDREIKRCFLIVREIEAELRQLHNEIQ